MQKGQGALEYLIIVTAVLAIAAIVVLFLTGALGGQQKQASFSACKNAAINCKNAKLLTPDDPCISCDTACVDLQGNDIITGTKDFGEGSAVWYCKQGKPEEIYERPPGPVCGNGIIETGETCDSNSVDCSTLGSFESGTNAPCKSDCSGYDTSVCTPLVQPLTVFTTANPTSGKAPLIVSFTCSGLGGTSPYSYSWVFGDGNTSTQQSPSHTYLSAGTYTAVCTVTDSSSPSKTGSSSEAITVTSTVTGCQPKDPNYCTSNADCDFERGEICITSIHCCEVILP